MNYVTGQLVLNKKLGLGKVLSVKGDSVTVFFKDQNDNPRTINVASVPMEVPIEQSDPWLDNLDLAVAAEGAVKHYLTHGQAVQKFLEYFPKGFHDPKYISQERDYKMEAHSLWSKNLNRREFQNLLDKHDYTEVSRRALQIEGKTNLLAMFEKAALKQALDHAPDAEAFAIALFDLIYAESEFEHRFVRFSKMLDHLPQPKTPLRWTVQTIFPFIAMPKEHMFLKPAVTQQAAERRAFSLNYQSQPNWLTYSCLLKLADILMKDLANLKPRDMVDIQSFIFVTGESQNYT